MDRVALLNRTDTKFVMSGPQLKELLLQCQTEYRSLEINHVRVGRYQTLYYDTPDFHFYNEHHRGKESRYKVRMREYIDSNLFFLEVKYKNKGRTDKKRIKIPGLHDALNPTEEQFVDKILGRQISLKPTLWNRFRRITLVNEKYPERVTIDLDLGFRLPTADEYVDFPQVVIAEVKQENRNRNTLFMRSLKSLSIRECGMSKYCIGTSLLVPGIKYNNFKPRILQIEKINNAA